MTRPSRSAPATGSRARRSAAMTDVAALAGVSHQTVSRVLNGHPHVREQTRVRVRAAMEQLNYRPNGAAKALVTGRSQVVGIVTQSSTLFGPASLLTAVEQAVSDSGLAVSVASVRTLDRTSISAAVQRLLDQRVGGIVVIAPVVAADEALDVLPDDLPYVCIDGDPAQPHRLVTIDQAAGARRATEHLLELGHDTVWHVSGPDDWFDSVGRRVGWEQALRDAGAEVPPVVPADWTLAAGERSGQMLGRIAEATAVFAANDHLALGIMKALREMGRDVPGDVSIVGFDDIPEAAYLTPPLTTVRPDFAAAARQAVEVLMAQLRDEPPAAPAPLVPQLVTRGSTARPAPRRRARRAPR